jgi:hypothetical protein
VLCCVQPRMVEIALTHDALVHLNAHLFVFVAEDLFLWTTSSVSTGEFTFQCTRFVYWMRICLFFLFSDFGVRSSLKVLYQDSRVSTRTHSARTVGKLEGVREKHISYAYGTRDLRLSPRTHRGFREDLYPDTDEPNLSDSFSVPALYVL